MATISDIANVLGGFAFKSSNLGSAGVPVVKIADIQPPIVALDSCDRVAPEKTAGLDRFLLKNRDIVMAMTGATTGKVARFRSDTPAYLNQRVAKLSAKAGPEFDDYLYAVVTQPGFDRKVLQNAAGSAQPNVSADGIGRIEILQFSKREQLEIGRIVAELDDKIELNRKMSTTLEATARALFKSWFVDFDPVRAKADGRDSGVPPKIAAQFPTSFEESELGEIPKGWRSSPLSNLADVSWGDTATTKASYTTNGFRAYSASGPDGYLPYFDYERVGVVVSAIGANSGTTWLASGKWSCIKNTLRFWSTSVNVPTEYLFFALLGKEKWPLRGSAQPFISQTDARALKVLIPGNNLASEFGMLVRELYSRVDLNVRMNRTLAEIRDTLLPKLISGEVRIHDAERVLEQSA